MISEDIIVRRWLYAVLSADAELKSLGITDTQEHPADDGSAFPIITWSTQSPFLVNMNMAGSISQQVGTMHVRVVGQTDSYEEIADAYARMDQLLHGALFRKVNGGTVLSCFRTVGVPSAGPYQGREYRSLGAIYRIQVRADLT